MASWAAAVLQINCLTAAADALQPFSVAAPKCAQLRAKVEELAEATVAAESASVLTACGLADKLALVTMYAEGTDHSNQVCVCARLEPAFARCAKLKERCERRCRRPRS